MWNLRHALISSRCAWCARVWSGKDWVTERRPPGRETYAHGICEECASRHFSANADRTQLNVERFRMAAPSLDKRS